MSSRCVSINMAACKARRLKDTGLVVVVPTRRLRGKQALALRDWGLRLNSCLRMQCCSMRFMDIKHALDNRDAPGSTTVIKPI